MERGNESRQGVGAQGDELFGGLDVARVVGVAERLDQRQTPVEQRTGDRDGCGLRCRGEVVEEFVEVGEGRRARVACFLIALADAQWCRLACISRSAIGRSTAWFTRACILIHATTLSCYFSVLGVSTIKVQVL